MTLYKEYKLADKVRAENKRAECVHILSGHLYYVCGDCGKRVKVDIIGKKITEPIFLLDLLCQSCSELTIA